MKVFQRIVMTSLVLFMSAYAAAAQSGSDPAMQKEIGRASCRERV